MSVNPTYQTNGTPVNVSNQDVSGIAGQVSSRNIVIMVPTPESNNGTLAYMPLGGISNFGFSVDNQAIPLTEIGSDKIFIVDGRPMPFRIQMTKNYINGRSLLGSIFQKNLLEAELAKDVPAFVTYINRPSLKQPTSMALVFRKDIVAGTAASPNYLTGIYLESYNLMIDADRVVISESATFMGEKVSTTSPLAAKTASNSSLSETSEPVNTYDIDEVSKAGSTTAITMVLCIKVTNGSSEDYVPIGGIRSINLSVSNQIFPTTEIGSDTNFLVMGRPNPAQIQLGKVFINRKNLLSSLSSTVTKGDYTKLDATMQIDKVDFELNIANDILSSPQDYAILVYKKSPLGSGKGFEKKAIQIINIGQARILNYNFSANEGIALQESVSMMGEIQKEIDMRV